VVLLAQLNQLFSDLELKLALDLLVQGIDLRLSALAWAFNLLQSGCCFLLDLLSLSTLCILSLLGWLRHLSLLSLDKPSLDEHLFLGWSEGAILKHLLDPLLGVPLT
jgi:hypothetical protein